MRTKSLLNKNLTQFITCTAVLLLLATPLFYWLTKFYYAEDLIEVIESIRQGAPIPDIDLEEDIMKGIMLQFGLIAVILGAAIVITMGFIAKNSFKPFYRTLNIMESFRLESGKVPQFPKCDVKEFNTLNESIEKLIRNSVEAYRSQKEFTENASHELQTPLAILRGKLDLLMQQPDLSQAQAEIIQDFYQTTGRLTMLNRNLLLLAKIDNRQYNNMTLTDVTAETERIIPGLETLAEGIKLRKNISKSHLKVMANKALLESLINNLVVNAVRHNKTDGEITLTLNDQSLIVSNTSDRNKSLDAKNIFHRFYRPDGGEKGNGLGLAIVKAICEYHGWTVNYRFEDSKHVFTVYFNVDNKLKHPSV